MRHVREGIGVRIVVVVAALAGLGPSTGWAAGPLLDVAEPVVAPGETVAITVLGEAGQDYVLAVSRVDAGLTLDGRALALGQDAVVIATGQLDGEGRAAVRYAPPFGPDGPTRVHLQALTGTAAEAHVTGVTPGKVLRVAPWAASTAVWSPVGSVPVGTTSREDRATVEPGREPTPATIDAPLAGLPRLGLGSRAGAPAPITAVLAGTGLTGGGTSGAVTLRVEFAGAGHAASVARSDHDHDDRYVTGLYVLTYTGQTTRASGSTSSVKLRDLGSFTSTGGRVRVTLTTMVGGNGTACNFQLRVDGQASGPVSASGLTGDEASINGTVAGVPATLVSVFSNLPAGAHTIELWYRAVSSSCIENVGNYTRKVVIEESCAG